MRTYQGWIHGAFAERTAFVKPRAGHSDHEHQARAQQLDAVEAGVRERAQAEVERLRAEIDEINRRLSRRLHPEIRGELRLQRKEAVHEAGILTELLGKPAVANDPDKLPQFIQRHGIGYRARVSQYERGVKHSVYGRVRARIEVAQRDIPAVRRLLEHKIERARESA